jgi:hypothetical protein
MAQQVAVWQHNGLRLHTVLIETTERGPAAARVDAGGVATFLDRQEVADIITSLNYPGCTR